MQQEVALHLNVRLTIPRLKTVVFRKSQIVSNLDGWFGITEAMDEKHQDMLLLRWISTWFHEKQTA
jgi:hypothetical protein